MKAGAHSPHRIGCLTRMHTFFDACSHYRFITVLTDLQLPRFVMRHPDTASAVLLSMLQLTIDFAEQSQPAPNEPVDEALPPKTSGKHNEDDTSQVMGDENHQQRSAEELEALADELAADLVAQWGGVIAGVQTLDDLFGVQHGLLDVAGSGGGGDGFGQHDGACSCCFCSVKPRPHPCSFRKINAS